jgi:hypothetical protein
MFSHSCRLVLLVTVACCLAARANAQCTLASASVWNVLSGSWNTAGDWTPTGVPNGKNICLTNGTAVAPAATALNITESAANLQLGANNTLNVNDRNTLILNAGASVNNAGAISLNGMGNATNIYLLGGTANFTTTLSGGGTIRLANSSSDSTQIYADPGITLENVDNTIQGVGHVGGNFGSLTFRNDSGGTLNANVNGGTLVLDATAAINAGQFTATGGGTLRIATTVNNTGGTISTDAASQTVLSNATIQGGTLSGNVQATAGSTLDGATHGQLTNAGTLTNNNGNLLTVGGTIFNSGRISVNAAGSATSLYVGNGTVTTVLSGGGTLTLGDTAHGGNAMIYGDGGATLENQNNKIQGEGQIGANHFFMLNNDAGGTVNANVAGRSLILHGGYLTNAGVLEATNQGRLEIATDVNNRGGTITSNPGSLVLLDNLAVIEGGTLKGDIQTNQTFAGVLEILDGVTNGPITSLANITIKNASQLETVGAFNNVGNLILNGGALTLGTGALTNNYQIEGFGVLSGPGTLTNNSVVMALGGTLDLTGATIANFSGGKLTGGAWWSGEVAPGAIPGPLKLPGNIITNAADIELIGSGAQILNAANANALAGLNTNAGNLGAVLGASLAIDGSLTNDNAAGLSLYGLYVADGGSAAVGGDLINSNHALVQVSAGSLTVAGDFTNSASTVQVESGGLVSVTGAFTQTGGFTDIHGNGTITADSYALDGGTLLVDGVLDPAGVIVASGSELTGSGVIDADVSNAGYVSPGDGSGGGALTVDGDYTQSALGFFEEEIGSMDDFGSLLDSGTTSLDGTLDITLLNGYVPDIGATFFFLNASAVNGAFAHVNGLINGVEDFEVIYGGSGVELQVTAAPEPGSFGLLMGALLVGLSIGGSRRGTRR